MKQVRKSTPSVRRLGYVTGYIYAVLYLKKPQIKQNKIWNQEKKSQKNPQNPENPENPQNWFEKKNPRLLFPSLPLFPVTSQK